MIEPVLFWHARLQLWLAGLSAITLSMLVFGAAVMRYAFGSPWNATEEVVGFLFYSAALFSMPAAAWEDRHIRMDFVDRLSPQWFQRICAVLATAALIIMLVALTIVCIENAEFSRDIGARSEITRLNLYPWMIIAPICLTSMAVIVLYRFLNNDRPCRSLLDSSEVER